MKRMLYLMRHGLTLFNVLDRMQGWSDSPLVELGVTQARDAAAWLKERGVIITHAYSSPTSRAMDTCELATGMTPVLERDLREICFGTLEGAACYLGEPMQSEGFRRYGGECQADVEKRMVTVLDDIMMRPDHTCIFAVSHGKSNQLFKDHWATHARMDLEGMPPNGGILAFGFDTETHVFSLEDAYLPKQSQHISRPQSKIGYLY